LPNGATPPLVPFAVTGIALRDGSVGAPYVYPLIDIIRFVRGGRPPYQLSLANGSSVPPGLSILHDGDRFSNLIVGVPTAAGDFTFTFTFTDAIGQSVNIQVTQHISPVSLSPSVVAAGAVGTPYSVVLSPSGGVAPYSIMLDPTSDLPPGLTLNGGTLSGTPTAPGNFVVLLNVLDSIGNTFSTVFTMAFDNAAGEAPSIDISPKAIQLLYQTGSPNPPAIPVTIRSTSGALAFDAVAAGIPGMTL